MKNQNPLTCDLLHQFIHIQRLLHRFHESIRSPRGPLADPNRGQGRVLALLKMQPKTTQKDLSYLLDMRPQSLGELLIKLEKAGYITRTPSEEDRRIMNIELTEAGANLSLEEEGRGKAHSFFDCLTEEEQTTLLGYLGRISESIEEKLPDEFKLFGKMREHFMKCGQSGHRDHSGHHGHGECKGHHEHLKHSECKGHQGHHRHTDCSETSSKQCDSPSRRGKGNHSCK